MSENAGVAKRLEKFPAFDGFRGIGVVVVVFTHCPQVRDRSAYNAIWYVNQLSRVGYIALDIFFVISGFFITRLLLPVSTMGADIAQDGLLAGLPTQRFSPGGSRQTGRRAFAADDDLARSSSQSGEITSAAPPAALVATEARSRRDRPR
jgi:hypothetical protein